MTSRFKVRSEQSRRAEAKPSRFPLKVPGGEVVLRERRVNPDRRHPGIQTQEIEMSSEEFDQLFETFSQQG